MAAIMPTLLKWERFRTVHNGHDHVAWQTKPGQDLITIQACWHLIMVVRDPLVSQHECLLKLGFTLDHEPQVQLWTVLGESVVTPEQAEEVLALTHILWGDCGFGEFGRELARDVIESHLRLQREFIDSVVSSPSASAELS